LNKIWNYYLIFFLIFWGKDRNYVLFEWIDGVLFYNVLNKELPNELYFKLEKW
jgi:hypothetical protein